jgi:hypothetical protein
MFFQVFISAPQQNIDSCEGETSNILCHYKCQKWYVFSKILLKNFKQIEKHKTSPESTALKRTAFGHFTRPFWKKDFKNPDFL